MQDLLDLAIKSQMDKQKAFEILSEKGDLLMNRNRKKTGSPVRPKVKLEK